MPNTIYKYLRKQFLIVLIIIGLSNTFANFSTEVVPIYTEYKIVNSWKPVFQTKSTYGPQDIKILKKFSVE